LNYFGFPAGTPDGVLGRNSRSAISNYQFLLGEPATGRLSLPQKDFMLTSYSRAIAGGYSTTQLIAKTPRGASGLLLIYKKEAVGQSATTNTVTVVSTGQNANASPDFIVLQRTYNDNFQQIRLLEKILANAEASPDSSGKKAKIAAIKARLNLLRGNQIVIETNSVKKYSTPIRPINGDEGATALKLSEVFPKIPYYVPGTKEAGEMWVAPKVTNEGNLVYNFNFMDPKAKFATVRDSIIVTPSNVKTLSNSFVKVNDWTAVAKKKALRKRFMKRVACFPQDQCQEKKTGNSSTEVDFVLYEDGSTAAKVQRNKGEFSAGYNFSVESALLMAGYLDFMRDVGQNEFTSGTMTNADLDDVFK